MSPLRLRAGLSRSSRVPATNPRAAARPRNYQVPRTTRAPGLRRPEELLQHWLLRPGPVVLREQVLYRSRHAPLLLRREPVPDWARVLRGRMCAYFSAVRVEGEGADSA